MKKSNVKTLLTLLLVTITVLSVAFALVACNDNENPLNPSGGETPSVFHALKGQSDRVILFIGDGMGENHIKVTEAYFEKQLYFDDIATKGYMSTNCSAQFQATDSAAAASAMATGEKYYRGYISYKDGKSYQTISEYAKSLGKGVGIVTTDVLSGATPAGFSAHARSRSDKETIINCQIDSGIDLFLGAGKNNDDYDDTVYYADYQSQFEEKGYTYCTTYDQLSLDSEKVIGAFSKIANYDATNETPTLRQLAEFAVDFLEAKYPNGYFLMVEGAHIDKCSSNKDIMGMVQYLDELDNAVEGVSVKITNDDNYTIIVTADHECGDLQYNGETKDQITDNLYNSKYHTGVDVPFYLDWKLKSCDFEMPNKIDNTDIFRICYYLLSGEDVKQ